MKTYIFKASLLPTSPKVWGNKQEISRDIEVLENINLYKLAKAIIDAYNFDFDHCFGFFSKIVESRYFDSEKKYELFTDLIEEGEDLEPTGAGSVKKTKVKDVWRNTGDKMMFLFDYGDSWQFVVKLTGFGEKKSNQKYPRVLQKIGRAPRQY